MKKLFLLIFLLFASSIFSQEKNDKTVKQDKSEEKNKELQNKELPSGFQDLNIGDSFDNVKDKLKKDNQLFNYKEEDVVFDESSRSKNIISSLGYGFLKNAVFQFNKEKLYTMSFYLDSSKIDYFSLSKSFKDKWGIPSEVTPNNFMWENNSVRILLEKPLIVRYIDLSVLKEEKEAEKQNKTTKEEDRQEFLKLF